MRSALPKGGPAGLFLGFAIWSLVMLAVNECFGMSIPITCWKKESCGKKERKKLKAGISDADVLSRVRRPAILYHHILS